VAPLRDPEVGVVGGTILSRRPCGMIEAFGERIHDHARALTRTSPPYAITMNWASRRLVLQRIGLFNEALLRSSDVDCSYRMLAAGYRLAYEPRAIIYHRNERTPWGLMHEGYVHGFHAPRVRHLHAAFLRQVRAERARAAHAAAPAPDASAPHWSDELWWWLFNLGKRIGRLHGTWTAGNAAAPR
jgi:GT2 family glycosyltransferase